MPRPPILLGQTIQNQWLVQHIPHRIRAVLPGIPMRSPWFLNLSGHMHLDPFSWRCVGNSMWEGRLTAIRWLILFVGISANRQLQPIVAEMKHPQFDVRIDRFTGGRLLSPTTPEGRTLAQVYAGCSKATAHPTEGTNHPDTSEIALAGALHIVLPHLESTIYAANGLDLRNFCLKGP